MLRLIKVFLIFVSLASFLACEKSTLKSSGEQFSKIIGSVQPAIYYGVFYQPSNLSLPPYRVSFFSKLNSGDSLPINLVNSTLAGDRRQETVKQPLNYFVRMIQVGVTDTNGDFYYECPVLSDKFELNPSSTALTAYLKYGFSTRPSLSRKNWKDMLHSLELSIPFLTKKNTTEILNIISTDPQIKANILNFVRIENPTIAEISWTTPQPELVWTEPPLKADSATSSLPLIVKEDTKITGFVEFWDPGNSNSRILVDTYTHFFDITSVDTTTNSDTFSFYLDLNSAGSHSVQATKVIGSTNYNFTFPYTVTDKITPPVWAANLKLTFIANRLNKIKLDDKVAAEGTTITAINLVSDGSTPSGMNLDKDVATGFSFLKWQPVYVGPNSDPVMSGSINLVAKVVDPLTSESIETPANVPYEVLGDHIPFYVSPPTNLATSEGTEVRFILETQDDDLDPLNLKLSTSSAAVLNATGSPVGSGLVSFLDCKSSLDAECAPYVSTSLPGHQYFIVKFTPSYSQTINSDSSFDLSFEINYDTSVTTGNPDLVKLPNPVLTSVHFTVTNVDDPPVLVSNDLTEQYVTEGTYFPAFLIANVKDATLNPTALTAALVAPGDGSCNWWDNTINDQVSATQPLKLTISADGSGGYNIYLEGTPPINSNPLCTFDIQVLDANQNLLNVVSPSFNVTDVNSPIANNVAQPDPNPIDEGVPSTIDFGLFFSDLDLQASPTDPLETVNLSCTDCNTVPGMHNFNVLLTSLTYSYTWTPPAYTVVGAATATYPITLVATDKGGVVATRTVNLTFNNQPGAPAITAQDTVTVDELKTKLFNVTVSAASADAADVFDYDFNWTPISCGSGLINGPAVGTTGNTGSSTDFSFFLNPSTKDGNSPNINQNFKSCTITVKVQGPTASSIATKSIAIVVNNVNRNPTSLKLTYGASNTSTNILSPSTPLQLTLSPPSSSSTMYLTQYSIALSAIDPDLTEDPTVDKLSYDLATTSGGINLGAVNTSNAWKFFLPSCLIYKSGTSGTIKINVTVNDGRSGSLKQNVKLAIPNTQGTCNFCAPNTICPF